MGILNFMLRTHTVSRAQRERPHATRSQLPSVFDRQSLLTQADTMHKNSEKDALDRYTYVYILLLVLGREGAWRAWALPPCTLRVPFHKDGAMHVGVAQGGRAVVPMRCAGTHTPRPWLPPCRAGSAAERPGGDAPNHHDTLRLQG